MRRLPVPKPNSWLPPSISVDCHKVPYVTMEELEWIKNIKNCI